MDKVSAHEATLETLKIVPIIVEKVNACPEHKDVHCVLKTRSNKQHNQIVLLPVFASGYLMWRRKIVSRL